MPRKPDLSIIGKVFNKLRVDNKICKEARSRTVVTITNITISQDKFLEIYRLFMSLTKRSAIKDGVKCGIANVCYAVRNVMYYIMIL